ncbi:hypothetical protein ACLBWZ_14395 [Brucellaceae bacterium C25G]
MHNKINILRLLLFAAVSVVFFIQVMFIAAELTPPPSWTEANFAGKTRSNLIGSIEGDYFAPPEKLERWQFKRGLVTHVAQVLFKDDATDGQSRVSQVFTIWVVDIPLYGRYVSNPETLIADTVPMINRYSEHQFLCVDWLQT